MSKFSKVLIILILILLVEVILIYKGYLRNKNEGFPTIKEIRPYICATHVANGILDNMPFAIWVALLNNQILLLFC